MSACQSILEPEFITVEQAQALFPAAVARLDGKLFNLRTGWLLGLTTEGELILVRIQIEWDNIWYRWVGEDWRQGSMATKVMTNQPMTEAAEQARTLWNTWNR